MRHTWKTIAIKEVNVVRVTSTGDITTLDSNRKVIQIPAEDLEITKVFDRATVSTIKFWVDCHSRNEGNFPSGQLQSVYINGTQIYHS